MKFKVDHAVIPWWKFWEQKPAIAWMLSLVWLLLISWLAFLWHLGSTGLVDETEPLFAEAARQMTVTGDWITPYFNGETRFDKPPLIYWLMALGYQIIGVNEWAVRLPSALGAIALTVLAFLTLRTFGISRPVTLSHSQESELDKGKASDSVKSLWLSAWLGAAMIALNAQTIIWARTGVSDMLLSGCMGCALLSFFQGYAQAEKARDKVFGLTIKDRWYLAFYFLIALAVLTKGPVGFVLPALIIGAFLLYLGNARQVLQEMRLLPGIAIIVFLTLPWYVVVTVANGEAYLDSFFGYHNFQRFTDVVNGHQAPWYFYFLVVLIGFAPWSVYLPVAIARLRFWQRKRWCSSPRSTHLGLFALFWFAGIFGFFTVAVTKLPSYTLPLLPAAAILVALLWSDQSYWQQIGKKAEVNQPRSFNLFFASVLFNIVLLLAIAGAIFFIPQLVGYDPAVPNLSELLHKSGLPVQGGLIWGITGVIVVFFLLQRRHWSQLWLVNFVGFVAFTIFVLMPVSFLIDEARQLPLRELSVLAAEVQQPGEEFLMIGFKKPSVVFYSQRKVTFFPQQKTAMAYIRNTAAHKSHSSSFLILLHQRKLKQAKLESEEYTHLDSVGAYELIRISRQVVANNY